MYSCDVTSCNTCQTVHSGRSWSKATKKERHMRYVDHRQPKSSTEVSHSQKSLFPFTGPLSTELKVKVSLFTQKACFRYNWQFFPFWSDISSSSSVRLAKFASLCNAAFLLVLVAGVFLALQSFAQCPSALHLTHASRFLPFERKAVETTTELTLNRVLVTLLKSCFMSLNCFCAPKLRAVTIPS